MGGQNVVVDTDVYSVLYTDPERAARRGLPARSWQDALVGARVLISFQTRAEVLAGLRAGNWGDRRQQAALAKLDGGDGIYRGAPGLSLLMEG